MSQIKSRQQLRGERQPILIGRVKYDARLYSELGATHFITIFSRPICFDHYDMWMCRRKMWFNASLVVHQDMLAIWARATISTICYSVGVRFCRSDDRTVRVCVRNENELFEECGDRRLQLNGFGLVRDNFVISIWSTYLDVFKIILSTVIIWNRLKHIRNPYRSRF